MSGQLKQALKLWRIIVLCILFWGAYSLIDVSIQRDNAYDIIGNMAENLIQQDQSYENAEQIDLEPRNDVVQEVAPPVYRSHQWVIDAATSTLSFEATQYGQKFNGSFNFTGEIIFDPENIDEGSATIEIDLASVTTGSLDRDVKARSEGWFDVERYPIAIFRASSFSHDGEEGNYIAHGVLDLHGVGVPLDLPFFLLFQNDEDALVLMEDESKIVKQSDSGLGVVFGEKEMAKTRVEMLSQIVLNRYDFGIGQAGKEDNEAVGDKVEVFIVLNASQDKPLD